MIFKPEDFREYCIKNPGAPHDECIAEISNKKLNEWLENAITVYGTRTENGFHTIGNTHKAKLVLIEEIKSND